MRIAIVPYTEGNPYQKLLADELEALGCAISKYGSLKQLFSRDLPDLDVVHLHWPPVFDFRPMTTLRLLRFVSRVRALKKRGVALVWTVHNAVPHESSFKWADLLLARAIAGHASTLICHSDEAKQRIHALYRVPKDKISIIPHGNYIGQYPNDLSREEARRQLEIAPQEIVLLSLGLIRPYKAVVELIEEFKKAAPENTRLLVAGRPTGGITEQTLAAAANGSQKISIYPRFIEDDEIQVFLNAADIVAFTYKRSLTSGAILLATSFGKACLAFDTGAVRSAVSEQGCILLNKDDEASLGVALRALPEYRDRFEAMGRSNFARAQELGWDRIAQLTLSAFRACREEFATEPQSESSPA